MNQVNHTIQFQREKTALKFFLGGRRYFSALKALGFVERHNVGFRKDGVTPSLLHEIQIALTITQLKDILFEEQCIVAALLHDVQEDHQIESEVIEDSFGVDARNQVWRLTKKFAGAHKNKQEFINDIAMCPVASIVKGVDRNHNLKTMYGVFSIEKIKSYSEEARLVFLPMLKKASKFFPEQQAAYHAISQEMKEQIRFANLYVNAAGKLIASEAQAAEKIKELNAQVDNLTLSLVNTKNEIAELKNESENQSTLVNREDVLRRIKIAIKVTKLLQQAKIDQSLHITELLQILELSQLDLNEFDKRVTKDVNLS